MLAQRLDIPELVGRLLAARGIGPDTAGDFLAPKLRALLHIQTFVDMEDSDFPGPGLPEGNWKNAPAAGGGDGSSRLFIQKGSRMNDIDLGDEDAPF